MTKRCTETPVAYTIPPESDKPPERSFLGYHQFLWHNGSFEVWQCLPDERNTIEAGFYWHACFPGCLPDGEPHGPFPTAEGAYLDAIGD